MAIIQISKVLVRTGDEQDLPQLDIGELGYSTDVKKLYIGDDPNNNPENLVINNTEVLTEHSSIAFSQIDVANGANFTTSELHIAGGQNGYILETDGQGNISWGAKGSLVYDISDITSTDPALVTFSSNHILTNSQLVTISDVQGDASLAVGSLTGTLTANTISPIVSGSGTAFTSEVAVGQVLVRSSNTSTVLGTVLSIANNTSLTLRTNSFANVTADTIRRGPSGLNSTTAYVKVIASNQVELYADSALTTGVNTVPYTTYYSGGRVVGLISAGSSGLPGGSNTQVQFNNNGVFGGSANLTYNYTTGLLSVTGVANVTGNLNVTLNSTLGNLATANYFAGVLTTAAQPNITSVGTLSSVSVSGNATVGNLNTAGSVTAPIIAANTNGTGNNFKVGDDVWIGDINVNNTMVVKGQQDGANGYIVFGNSDTTSTLGRAGTGPLTYNGSFSATGNVTGGYILGNGSQLTGVLTTSSSSSVSTSGNVTGGNIISSNYIINSVTTGVTANGTTQGTATALTKSINIVSTVTSGANGVVLPTAIAGMTVYITNTSANALNVFPASGAAINTGSTDASISQGAGATLQFIAPTTTQWYTVGATYA